MPLPGIKLPYGYGIVNHCGRLNTKELISCYKETIKSNILNDDFDFSLLSDGPTNE